MSEIEKMYENAGVEKEVIRGCYEYYSKLGIDIWKENDCRGKNCDTCKKDKAIKEYPPFTAEKQIKLICFLLNADIKIDICKESNMKMEIYDIAEALAEVTNTIWQDLTEEEKQQVKGILE